MKFAVCAFVFAAPLLLAAQETNPTQANVQPSNSGTTPIFRVSVVSRSTQAVSYRHRSGWTKIDFKGTALAPQAKGTAEVNSRLGHAQIKLDIKELPSPRSFGQEFLTYVLWAITPDGHPQNLSEVVVDSHGNYNSDSVSTDLQAFGLIITAEPYYAVAMPSDVVVMENIIRTDTVGKDLLVDAKYELMPRGQYLYQVDPSKIHKIELTSDNKNPLEVYEAMNAVYIAQYARADQYASDQYQAAQALLNQAEDYQTRKQWKPAIMTAREAVQKAEDARLVSLRRQRDEALAKERQDAAERVAAAKANAAQEAQAAAEAARQRQLAEQQAQTEAAARAEADKARQEADAARAQANAAAEEANKLRAQAEADKEALRQRLLQQFNAILQTTETPRGLVINMSDVLFDFNKYDLKPEAREKLARLSGIIISHPGLNLKVEGYTDNVGTEDYNQKLSEKRAETVRDYLISNGIMIDDIAAVGYGAQYPVAPNTTAAGRAQNRRVQLVVSGEVIGVKIGATPGAAPTQPGTTPTAPLGPPPSAAPQQ
ncbi:MAG TPA: OmpA family protein [Bryobacteraceae bacterium]|nr:OmpA family protein [Bryobacteraceae bacterium]